MVLFAAGSSRAKVPPWVGLVLSATSACTIAPEPPPTPDAVVQLSASYNKPTANVDGAITRHFQSESIPNYNELKTLAGLSFVRGLVARALRTQKLDATTQGIDVQGSLAIHAPCPGWDAAAEPNESDTGAVDLIVGVDDSRVQRAFSGTVTACRFLANLGGQRAKVEASLQLEVDLGRSLALGDPVPAILMSASQLSAELSVQLSANVLDGFWAVLSNEVDPDGVKLELGTGNRALSLRIAGDDLVETLIDLEPLDLGADGTILLGLHDDGSFNLRGGDSAWNCSSDRSVACVRSD